MPTLNARENAVQHERGGYWTYKGPDTTENDATGSDKRSQQRPRNPGGRTRRRLDMYAVGPDLVWTVAEGHWV
uniref:Uncharacterized protein n=1 Tax=Coccidioides posadasii RMSCC 3488 TaxID=454284 RepID=A0A0J6FNI6_COCPO|nr:hypothetical protein CPAG_07302 [Coccidioides posadasii RMSCC 3488]